VERGRNAKAFFSFLFLVHCEPQELWGALKLIKIDALAAMSQLCRVTRGRCIGFRRTDRSRLVRSDCL